jgi:hypothetical protein
MSKEQLKFQQLFGFTWEIFINHVTQFFSIKNSINSFQWFTSNRWSSFFGHPHNEFSLLTNWVVHKWCQRCGKISKCWTSSQDVLESFWRWLSGVLRVTEYWRSLDAQSRDIAHRYYLWHYLWTAPSNFRFIIFAKTWSEFNQMQKKNNNNKKKRKIKFRSKKSLLQKFVDLFLNKQMYAKISLNFRSFEISRISQHFFVHQTKLPRTFFLFYLKNLVWNGQKLFLSSELREQLLARFSFRPHQIAEESSQKFNSISKSFIWLFEQFKREIDVFLIFFCWHLSHFLVDFHAK